MMAEPLVRTALSPSQKLRLAFGASTLIILLGMAGFMFIERMNSLDALYMTVITLSTVGYREVAPLHLPGKVFVILLILFGVVLAGFTASVIGQMVIEGELVKVIGWRKMERRIRKMHNHTIVAGFGRVGRQVATEFAKRKAKFVVIEKDGVLLGDAQSAGYITVPGDATDDDVLRQAGIDSATTLISTLPDEALNVYLAMTARFLNPKLKIIARADYEEGEKKVTRAGADHVVTPHVLGGQRMAMAALRPNVVDFMHMTALGEAGLSIEEMVIPDDCYLSGKTVLESHLRKDYGAIILGIKKPEQKLIVSPGTDTRLDSGDLLLLMGSADGLERLENKLSS